MIFTFDTIWVLNFAILDRYVEIGPHDNLWARIKKRSHMLESCFTEHFLDNNNYFMESGIWRN